MPFAFRIFLAFHAKCKRLPRTDFFRQPEHSISLAVVSRSHKVLPHLYSENLQGRRKAPVLERDNLTLLRPSDSSGSCSSTYPEIVKSLTVPLDYAFRSKG